jgi:hypothetical protein
LPPAAAEYSFETEVFFLILLRKIRKNTSVSNLNLARSAELCFERHVIFTISLREIVKMTCLSEEYSPPQAAKYFLHNPYKLQDSRSFHSCLSQTEMD